MNGPSKTAVWKAIFVLMTLFAVVCGTTGAAVVLLLWLTGAQPPILRDVALVTIWVWLVTVWAWAAFSVAGGGNPGKS